MSFAPIGKTVVFSLCLTIAVSSASAIDCFTNFHGKEIDGLLGWTADGRFLAYRYSRCPKDECCDKGTFDGYRCYLATYDTQTNQHAKYPIRCNSNHSSEFERWKANHPIRTTAHVQRCKDAQLIFTVENIDGYPEFATSSKWSNHRNTIAAGSSALLHFGVRQASVVYLHGEMVLRSHQYISPYQVSVSWSPTCRHIAWAFEPNGMFNSPFGFGKVHDRFFDGKLISSLEVRPIGPDIRIMAHKSAPALAETVRQALQAAGYPAAIGAAALQQREKTQIFSWKKDQALANQLAALIPGGADVKLLTWSAGADIVIAVGQSAQQGPAGAR